jgi:FixJ family two-component response regulator
MADPIRIALIDDDPAVLDSLRLYFERKKLQIDCFSTSIEFLTAVDRSAQFDCIESDVRFVPIADMLPGAVNLTDRSKLSHREDRECRSPP